MICDVECQSILNMICDVERQSVLNMICDVECQSILNMTLIVLTVMSNVSQFSI